MKDRIAELESRLARVEARLSVLEGDTPAPHVAEDELPEDRVATGIVHHAPSRMPIPVGTNWKSVMARSRYAPPNINSEWPICVDA